MLMLSACAQKSDPRLSERREVSGGPDEFNVLPVKPLQQPESYTALPEPTPGGTNITDPTPKADAIVALGGRLQSEVGGIPSADAALIAHTMRHGTTEDIRATLAEADAKIAPGGRRGVLGLFRSNRYFRAYANQALDAYAELERLRALGLRTPSAPPGG
jgi:hypothetical protein